MKTHRLNQMKRPSRCPSSPPSPKARRLPATKTSLPPDGSSRRAARVLARAAARSPTQARARATVESAFAAHVTAATKSVVRARLRPAARDRRRELGRRRRLVPLRRLAAGLRHGRARRRSPVKARREGACLRGRGSGGARVVQERGDRAQIFHQRFHHGSRRPRCNARCSTARRGDVLMATRTRAYIRRAGRRTASATTSQSAIWRARRHRRPSASRQRQPVRGARVAACGFQGEFNVTRAASASPCCPTDKDEAGDARPRGHAARLHARDETRPPPMWRSPPCRGA